MLIAVAALAFPAVAAPAPTIEIALGRPCALAGAANERPEKIIGQRARFDCSIDADDVYGPVTWGLFDGLNVAVKPDHPLLFRHGPHPFQSQRAFARLADGRVIDLGKSVTGGTMALSSAVVSYDLPALGSPVTAVLIREEGMQHQRGIATEAFIISGAAAARIDGQLVLLFAVLAGIVFALLFFNAALYATLRYRFILANCAANAAILLISLTWAGSLLPFMPNLALIDQISVMQFGISVHLAFSVLFMLSFIEREHLHRWAKWIILPPIALGCTAAAMRLVDVQFQWERVDVAFYVGLAAANLAKLYLGIDAMRRGSRAARIFLMFLMVPTLLGLVRLVWGVTSNEPAHIFVAISPTLIMVASALLDSLAVSWRISVLRDERNQAFEMAETDLMTGLYNHRAFAARAMIGDHPKQLVVLDIDRFKAINDNFGHQVGDAVIIQLADLLRATAPADAVVGRLGGDEFAILTRANVSSGVGEAIRHAVAAAAFPQEISVSVSIGTTLASIGSEQQWSDAYGAADGALFQAKRGGRNQVSEVAVAAA